MSNGNRMHCFAIVGCLVGIVIAAHLVHMDPSRERSISKMDVEQSESKKSFSENNDFILSDHTPEKSDTEPSNINKPCQKGQDDRNSDLCAQWKAADAARTSANWTKYGVISGLAVGIGGLIGAGLAVYYAQKAFSEAREANRIAHESMINDARAWLSIEHVRLVSGTSIAEEDSIFRIEVKACNHGKTVAKNVQINVELINYLCDNFKKSELNFLDSTNFKARIPTGTNLFPSDTYVYTISFQHDSAAGFDANHKCHMSILIATSYHINGTADHKITYQPFSLNGLDCGLSIGQNTFYELERMPFKPGTVT